MSKATDSNSDKPEWLTKPLTREEIEACRDAGASHAFLAVLQTDTPDGVSRHSVRIETKKQLRSWGKDPSEMTQLAGDFFTGLWQGDRRRYEGHADRNNQRILRKANVI